MTASYHTGKMGKRYPHYWCKNSGCLNKNRTILKKDIDTDFIKLLNELQPKKEVINLAEAVLNDMWADRQKYEEQRRAGITKDMQGIDIKIKNYLDRITSNSSSVIAKHYELEIEKLDKEKTALEAELNKQRYLDYDFKPACRTVFNFLENPLKNWKDPLYSRKRIFLHMYFERGLAYDKQNGFGTPELPCVIKVITQKHVSKKSLVEMPGVKPGSKTNSSTHYSQD